MRCVRPNEDPRNGIGPPRCRLVAIVVGILGFGAGGFLAAQGIVDRPGITDVILDTDLVLTAAGPQDSRFFGEYCSRQPVTLCETVPVEIAGIEVFDRELCADVLEIRVSLDHHVTAEQVSRGVLRGSGTVRTEDGAIGVCYAGRVQETGRAEVVGRVPGAGPREAELELSSDGTEVKIRSDDHELVLSKEACGNRAPDVALVAPADGAVLERRCLPTFQATYSDDRDATIPESRVRFHSHRDGVLDGTLVVRPGLVTLEPETMSLGDHAVTFLATDAGGLENGRSITVEVRNDPTTLCLDEVLSDGSITLEAGP